MRIVPSWTLALGYFLSASSAGWLVASDDSCEVCQANQVLMPLVNSPASKPNGCGPAHFGKLVPDFNFGQCCDQHDRCYGSCNTTKPMCDGNLRSCMQGICDDSSLDNPLGCDHIVNLYLDALSTRISCDAYKNSVKNHCSCNSTDTTTPPESSTQPPSETNTHSPSESTQPPSSEAVNILSTDVWGSALVLTLTAIGARWTL